MYKDKKIIKLSNNKIQPFEKIETTLEDLSSP